MEYEEVKQRLSEAQFELWWYICAEASMCHPTEDMPEIERENFEWVKALTDEEAEAELEKEML